MRNPISTVRKAIAHLKEPRRSNHWPAVREAWLLDHGECAACGSKTDLDVHHKQPFHLFPELELDSSNFITLCESICTEHHLKVGHTVNGKSSWKLYNPHVEQDAVIMRSFKP